MKAALAFPLLLLAATLSAAEAKAPDIRLDNSPLPIGELQQLMAFGIILCYVFAAGRIADFLQSTGKRISKREMLYAPFAYMLFSMLGVLGYFSSGSWVPPQNTIITLGVYLLLIPLGISIGIGTVVLYSFFRDRLGAVQALDLSMKIVLAPVFDGIRGYWIAIGAAALVVGLSAASWFSSGGNFSLVTFDFLLASAIAALYFLYKAATSRTNEGRASNAVTLLTIMAPSILRLYFREIVCALLTQIPLDFFAACPLNQVGNEVTLALSVAATLVILIPIVPLVYAVMVNVLRAATVVQVLMKKEQAEKPDKTG